MRTIKSDRIREVVKNLCIEANIYLPDDVTCALRRAAELEKLPHAISQLRDMGENIARARERHIPLCQDTGMAVLFFEVGQEVFIDGPFEEAVNLGVADGCREGFLRASVVGDPLRRANTGDNTPAVIHTRLVPGDRIEITLLPKGFGSENMSSVELFTPSATREDVIAFVVAAVKRVGSNPCPPLLLGLGLGGTLDRAAELSKRALLRPVGEWNPDPFYAEMEGELLRRVNETGVGPQGLGGETTALWAAIETYPTHIAGLPAALSIGCHVSRRASAVI